MTKRFAALSAALCLTLCSLTTASAAYFPRYTGASGSIAVALDSLGTDPSYSSRAKIAAAGHPDVVVVLVTNSDDYKDLSIQTGSCELLKPVIRVK